MIKMILLEQCHSVLNSCSFNGMFKYSIKLETFHLVTQVTAGPLLIQGPCSMYSKSRRKGYLKQMEWTVTRQVWTVCTDNR